MKPYQNPSKTIGSGDEYLGTHRQHTGADEERNRWIEPASTPEKAFGRDVPPPGAVKTHLKPH